jgi:hypothetical protein
MNLHYNHRAAISVGPRSAPSAWVPKFNGKGEREALTRSASVLSRRCRKDEGGNAQCVFTATLA